MPEKECHLSRPASRRGRSIVVFAAILLLPVCLRAGIDDGLLLYYDFNDAEAALADRSGNGRDGVAAGARWVDAGVGGGAMHLSGPQDSISASDEGFPVGDAPRSFSWWFALDSLRPSFSTDFMFYGLKNYNAFTALAIDWRHGRDCPAFSQWGGVYLSGRRIDQAGIWFHLVFTYGGNGNYTYYINGERWHGVSELHGPIETQLGGRFAIGSHSPSEVHSLDGYIDEVRVYDRELGADEAAALFRLGASVAGQPVRGTSPGEPMNFVERAETNVAVEAEAPVEPEPEVEVVEVGGVGNPAVTPPGGTLVQPAPAILQIGFSNDPEGDQDVTQFFTEESLHVRLSDVDLHAARTNVLVRMTVSQRDGSGKIQRAATSELMMDDQAVYRGSVALADFRPGFAQVDLIGVDREFDVMVLMRSSWIRISP